MNTLVYDVRCVKTSKLIKLMVNPTAMRNELLNKANTMGIRLSEGELSVSCDLSWARIEDEIDSRTEPR